MSFAEPTNITNVVGFFEYANTVTNNMTGIVILLCFFIVTTIAMKAFQTERAVVASLFLTSLVGVLFTALGLIGSNVMIILIVLCGFGVLYLFYSGNN